MCQARISGIYVQILCKRLTEHLFEKRKRVVTLSIYNSSLFSDLGETRTPNLLIRSQMLYPLSYEAIAFKRCKDKQILLKENPSDCLFSENCTFYCFCLSGAYSYLAIFCSITAGWPAWLSILIYAIIFSVPAA